ncbi:PAS domain-containing sensor histidine kinase [Spirosoma validum]|uniref:histidine kinase n=1 Tax=Spirosoma validum TaxID=2771355 RepID=A0A927AZW8_9BACT|nr:PAS domain-containing sensor histidine kinase [Spirosoma validum]MBD2752821.1 PAS domain-containing protein [Spirosoma validum]
MLTAQPTDVVLTELLDALPDAVIWMRAIRDQANRVINLKIEYANQKAQAMAKGVYQVNTGTLVLGDNGHEQAESEKTFRDLCTVLEANQPQEFSYFNEKLNSWLLINRTKLGDGVLSVTRNISALKAAEQINSQQANLLNSVLDSSSSGIKALQAVRDENGAIIDFVVIVINQMGATIRQRSVREIVGNQILQLFPGVRESGLFDQYVQVAETRESRRIHTKYPGGAAESWYDMSLVPFGDGLTVTYTDSSENRKAQQALEQSADQLRTVIDSAQVGIYLIHPVWNETGQIVDFQFRMANQMLASYVGQEPDVLIGKRVSDWFPNYLQNGLFNRYVVIYETGRTQHFNFHYKTDDVDFWISITATKLGDDVLITFSDYTDLKKLQQRLEAFATELQTIIDTSQTGIFLFSPVRNEAGEVIDFRFRVANRQLASYVGQEPEAVVGALGSQWFPDYKTNGLFDVYYKTYITGESQRFDFHYDGSGIDVWLDIMATKLGDEVLVTFGDYTPLKKLQQQLEKSVVSLQRSNKNLEQFAYVASHDLQEPLRKIQAFGDILQSQYASVIDESGADIIQRMQSAASRMQILIKDVLAYSRIATRRETIGPVDLNQIVRDVLMDIETAISDKQAVITVGQLPTISKADAAQLRQLFQNLISNALKFTRTDPMAPAPAISITAQHVYGRNIPELAVAPTDADQPFYLIEVTDNGIGFDPRQAERIFQVFQRLHNRSEYQGTGIGLAIVQKVIENHHGYIQADGRPGEGATFHVALPA